MVTTTPALPRIPRFPRLPTLAVPRWGRPHLGVPTPMRRLPGQVRDWTGEVAAQPGRAWTRRREARALARTAQGVHGTVVSLQDAPHTGDGILTTTGHRHVALLAVDGAPWLRWTETRQDALLDSYAWWITSLGHPVQWTVLTRQATLDGPAAALLEATGATAPGATGRPVPPAVRGLAERLAGWLRAAGPARGLRSRRYLLTVPSDHADRAQAATQLQTRCADLLTSLARVGLPARRLAAPEIAATLRDCWYPNLPPEDRPLTPDPMLAAGVDLARDACYLDHGNGQGHWVRGWRLTLPPGTVTGPWLLPLVGGALPLDLALHVTPLDPTAYKATLQDRVQRTSDTVAFLTRKSWPLWDGLTLAQAHTAAMLAAVQHNQQQKPYLLSLTATLHAPTREALERLTATLEGELRGLGGNWLRCDREHHLAARTCRPEGIDALAAPLEVDTSTAAHLLPAVVGWTGTGRPEQPSPRAILYGYDGDQPVLIDPFDARASTSAELNSTAIIVGPPGAGKSVTTKFWLASLLPLGVEAVVFDVEREYDPLCQVFGTAARTVTPGAGDSATNPWAFALAEGEQDAATSGASPNPVRARALALIGLLEVALGGKRGGLTDAEIAVADEAIMATYARTWTRSDGVECGGILADDPATWTRPAPWMACLPDVLATMPGSVAAGLRQGVLRYTTGTLAGLFAEQTPDLWTGTSLVRFDFRAVEEEQRPLATYLAMLAVWADQLARPRERLIVVDEAWQLFAFEHAAAQMEKIARRGRKWRLAPVYVFHTADDFTRSPHANAVRQCSALQLVLGQNEQSIDGIAALFHLSASDRQAALTAPKGAGFLFSGQGRAFVTLDLQGWPDLCLCLTGLQTPPPVR